MVYNRTQRRCVVNPFIVLVIATVGILATIYGLVWAIMRWLERCEAREKLQEKER